MISQSTAVATDTAMLDAVHRSALFDAKSQDAVQRTLRLAALSLHAPVAVLSIGDVTRQVLRSYTQPDAGALPAAAYAELMRQCHGSATFLGEAAVEVSGVPMPITFAAMPVVLRDSTSVIGMLAVADVAGRTDEQRIAETLRELASSLADELCLRAENVGLRQKEANLELQMQVFSLIAEGAPLDRILGSLASFIEHQSPGALCVIHQLGRDGLLNIVAAPTMPESLLSYISGIAPAADGCVSARAAFSAEMVVIADANALEAASIAGMVREGIRSAWSFPIRSNGSLFGTISMYRMHVGEPEQEHLNVISVATSAARIAIDRRQAEADLLSSEIYHRALIENSSEFILVLEEDGRARYVNRRFAQAVGDSPVVVRSLSDVVVPEDRGLLDLMMSKLLESHEQEFALRIVSADGSIRHIFGTGTNLLDNGAVRGLVINARDVTQQMLAIAAVSDSEERYRLVARASSDLIWDWDVSADRIVWPARDEASFGYAAAEMPGYKDGWLALIHPEDCDRVRVSLGTVLRDTEAATWSDEYRIRQKDGKYATVLDRGFVVRDDHGAPVRMIGSMMDLTARRMLEEQLRQAQRMEAIGRLAGGVAHDFNNLLTVIEGFTAILVEELGAEGVHGGSLVEIQKAASRASALTRQLLAFSRRQVLQPRYVDVNDVVHGVGGMLRRLIPADVTLDMQPSVGELLVYADIGQLEQVILNLVINAREAIHQGGTVKVSTDTVTLSRTDENRPVAMQSGKYVRLSVEDDGCGMDPDVVLHIFEPFFTTKESGTGLGLATVYGIVEQSGGHLEVHSQPGAGSRFDVYIPLSTSVPGEVVVPEVTRPSRSPGNEVVLIVEDDASVRQLTHKLLARQGYEVFAAADGPAALKMISTGVVAPDLLLTDVVLPHMSGSIVAERVLELKPDTAVVFMSGYTDEQLGRHGVLSAEVAFLQKPFQSGRLLTMVREQLDARSCGDSKETTFAQSGVVNVGIARDLPAACP
jgi:PAS domain S-box-containing protein